jgi:hypothetical protein
MPGLTINFEKSVVLLIKPNDIKLFMYDYMFNYKIGNWPIRYLGNPVCARRKTMTKMKFVKERINSRMEAWMSSTMSIGSRVTKIVASLTYSVVY